MNLTRCHCSADTSTSSDVSRYIPMTVCRVDPSPDWKTHPHCLWLLSPRLLDKAEGQGTRSQRCSGRLGTRSGPTFFFMPLKQRLPIPPGRLLVYFSTELLLKGPGQYFLFQKYSFHSPFEIRGKVNFKTK